MKLIPVIDIFAGPGGLGEGFASFKNGSKAGFELAASIEKDPTAHSTLLLRSIYRKIATKKVPDVYYEYISGLINKQEFIAHPAIKEAFNEASYEARNITLGDSPSDLIDKWISEKISLEPEWVLIGGPPCQAYSLAGRSKMINLDKDKYESDHRHLLYKEYLRIIKKHKPPIFLMENVKGILSSKFQEKFIFEKILSDLRKPNKNLSYEVRSLVVNAEEKDLSPKDYIVKCEDYGVPQARHRVILLGIRKDLKGRFNSSLKKESPQSVLDAIGDLPPIRSRLSKGEDSHINWLNCLTEVINLLSKQSSNLDKGIIRSLNNNLKKAEFCQSTGGEFIPRGPTNHSENKLTKWLQDPNMLGITHHTTRGHINRDIQRYFYLATYVASTKYHPNVKELPTTLLPNHKNISSNDTPFLDRFRVQIASTYSTTIVSHISKDGHYYIHPSPWQARSLTVREAARLQTFPDNYFFEGTRTQQYVQVGNAVPPLLANKIAALVYRIFRD